MIVAWFSGGATSAIACRMALTLYDNVRVYYIETGSHHPDAMRFLYECEDWLGVQINILRSHRYENVFDVIRKERFINGPTGAACTKRLKKNVRAFFEETTPGIEAQVWGFDFSPKEINRATRHSSNNPNTRNLYPLIENEITKVDALKTLKKAGILLPAMYRLGYPNANCIGCVKGGMAYWNKIRKDFPEVFEETSRLEQELGRSCLRRYFLKDLPLDAGRGDPPLVSDCGSVGEGCEIALSREFFGRE